MASIGLSDLHTATGERLPEEVSIPKLQTRSPPNTIAATIARSR
jgi:hypothetical protein